MKCVFFFFSKQFIGSAWLASFFLILPHVACHINFRMKLHVLE